MEAKKFKFMPSPLVCGIIGLLLIFVIILITAKCINRTTDPIEEATKLIIESEMKIHLPSLFPEADRDV